METKANYVLVGIFTLVAIVAAFVFVYWTAAIGDRGETAVLRVRIPGSAAGLGRGSAVLFNGVKVGDVSRVYIDVNDPSIAIADTAIDRLTPLTKSTKADIGIAGLTGQANIELKGANLEEPKLLDEAEATGRIAEITANPSAVTNLLETAQDIFTRADKVLSNLEGFVTDVRAPKSGKSSRYVRRPLEPRRAASIPRPCRRARTTPYYARVRTDNQNYGGTGEAAHRRCGRSGLRRALGPRGRPGARHARRACSPRRRRPTANVDDPRVELHIRVAVTTGEALARLDARPEQGEGIAAGDVVKDSLAPAVGCAEKIFVHDGPRAGRASISSSIAR